MITRSQRLGLVVSAGIALASVGAPAQAYTVYTSLAAWQAALSSYIISTDPFSNTIGSSQVITLDSGIVSTNSGPITLPNSFDNNSVNVVTSGAYDNAVQAGSGTASNSINWQFPTAVVAFGADFIGAGAGRLTLEGDFDGTGVQSLSVNNMIGGPNGFLGVIGTAPLTSVTFGNPQTTLDGFAIDNAYFAPVPGPLPVLGASAALGWSRRLRRRIAGQGHRS